MRHLLWVSSVHFFFFNDTATTEIYTLSLHDALPIYRFSGLAALLRGFPEGARQSRSGYNARGDEWVGTEPEAPDELLDRKSTRLNSSHANISYAVFCLKKKTTHYTH